jgi:hypothetical protein
VAVFLIAPAACDRVTPQSRPALRAAAVASRRAVDAAKVLPLMPMMAALSASHLAAIPIIFPQKPLVSTS